MSILLSSCSLKRQIFTPLNRIITGLLLRVVCKRSWFFQFPFGKSSLRDDFVAKQNSIAHYHVSARVACDILLVGHHNNSDATLIQLLKNCHDLDTRSAVEVSRRFVREQHFGIIDQCASNRHALLLTARKLAWMMIFAAAKSDRRKDAISFFAKLRICQAMRTVKQWQLDILPRRCARQEIKTLKDETNFAIANISEPIAIKGRNIGTIQKVMARSRPIETTEKIHQRGFPGTARAHQRHKFAALDLKRNAAHGVHFHFATAIGFVDVAQPDKRAVVHVDLLAGL